MAFIRSRSWAEEREKEMPSNVARFEQLMYLSLGIGVIVSTLSWSRNVAMGGASLGSLFKCWFSRLWC